MNVTFSDNFEDIITLGYPLKIVYSIIFILFELLGLSCYSGFIYFEHYGGDGLQIFRFSIFREKRKILGHFLRKTKKKTKKILPTKIVEI